MTSTPPPPPFSWLIPGSHLLPPTTPESLKVLLVTMNFTCNLLQRPAPPPYPGLNYSFLVCTNLSALKESPRQPHSPPSLPGDLFLLPFTSPRGQAAQLSHVCLHFTTLPLPTPRSLASTPALRESLSPGLALAGTLRMSLQHHFGPSHPVMHESQPKMGN